MKTLKLLNSCLLGLTAFLLVTAVFAFINGNLIYGICNIIWMGCEIFYFLVNKENIEIKSINNVFDEFLSAVDHIIEKHGAAIITEDKDGHWQIDGAFDLESGNQARPMKKEWVLNIKRQCDEQKVPFFFKSWGRYGEDGRPCPKDQHDLLDGIKQQAWPKGWEKGET